MIGSDLPKTKVYVKAMRFMTYPDKISTQTVATTPTAKTDNSLQDWFSDEMASDAIARDVALVNTESLTSEMVREVALW
jgi:hypothetical protein